MNQPYSIEFNKNKKRLIDFIDKETPKLDLYDLFYNVKREVNRDKVYEFANWISSRCDKYKQNEKDFVNSFLITAIYYLLKNHRRNDNTFEGLSKLIKIAEINYKNEKSTFHYLLDDGFKNVNKPDTDLLIEAINYKNIATFENYPKDFVETVETLIMKWRDENEGNFVDEKLFEDLNDKIKSVLNYARSTFEKDE